ncbi:diaminopimelate decarboxylase [Rugosimonospora acidiphila]|uniref:Diaminopimelate decarboxylase n=1 Tax=Rugosimonospora acidiphila TaxID=556531 RepID=A0ABP9SLM4_9ACTN
MVDVLPSLRTSLPQRLEPDLWPYTARRVGPELYVGEVSLSALAQRYGTPCYVLDEKDVRRRCGEYRAAFGEGAVSYAARAFTSGRLVRWMAEEGLGLSVCSAGELAVARGVGFPAERLTMHGDAKTPVDLRAATECRVGRVVVTSLQEISRLATEGRGRRQKVLLRVLLGPAMPGATGLPAAPDEERFGLSAGTEELDEAVRRVTAQPGLELVGLDYFLGSQAARFGGYEQALRRMLAVMADLSHRFGCTLSELNLGGGFAVPYRYGEDGFAVEAFASRWPGVVRVECERLGIPMPRLTATPGRALVARAGVALYRVLGIRHDTAGHQLVAVDGGLSDNPRPALYGARYTPALIGRYPTVADRPTTVVGRHGESGDVIARDVPLPGDLHPGDLLAVADCGAYHHSMASNYNLVTRPPVVSVRDGQTRVMIRRETIDDLLARDPDLAAVRIAGEAQGRPMGRRAERRSERSMDRAIIPAVPRSNAGRVRPVKRLAS